MTEALDVDTPLDRDLGALAARLAKQLEPDAAPRTLIARAHAMGASIGVHERWIVQLRLAPDDIVISSHPPEGGAFVAHLVTSTSDLDRIVPALRASIRAWANRLSVGSLAVGQRYRVLRDFEDFTGAPFAAGEELVLEAKYFLPYDDAHTLKFVSRTMYVREDTPVCDDFGALVGPA